MSPWLEHKTVQTTLRLDDRATKYLLSSPQFKHALFIMFKGYLKYTDVLSILKRISNKQYLSFKSRKALLGLVQMSTKLPE